jgi:hypothetical protein
MATRTETCDWRQTEPALNLCAVRWYLRYSTSFRDVEELLDERGLPTDHTTVWRWVQVKTVSFMGTTKPAPFGRSAVLAALPNNPDVWEKARIAVGGMFAARS